VKTRYAIYGIMLIGLFVFAIWELRTRTAHQKDFLRTVQNLKPLKKILIKPGQSSQATEIAITTAADLIEVQNALQHADLKPVSGHSGEIFESTITFVAANDTVLKFRATVHKYEPEDLYLSPDLLQQTKPRVFVAAGIPDRIRVPKLGNWITRKTKSDSPKVE